MRPDESVLDALVRGGATVRFSCRRGTCHGCLLRTTQGDAGKEAQEGLTPEQRQLGYFLPCRSFPKDDLALQRPATHEGFVAARLQQRQALSEKVVRLRLEAPAHFEFRAGQFVNVRARDVVRSYSIASSRAHGRLLELHVLRVPRGALSGYLCDELEVGEDVELQGPHGRSTYEPGAPTRALLLLGTGSGLAPLLGVVRDALHAGHEGPIRLYHGARDPHGLYLDEDLRKLERKYPQLRYVPCLSGLPETGYAAGRVTRVAFSRQTDLANTEVFLAGAPEMVHEARYLALLAGADRDRIHADPFLTSAPYMPKDGAKMAALPPEPELWEALEHGPGLTRILTDFYDRAFEDPRLAPFFHNVTKQRAIEKQYEFLRELFARDTTFFGLRPFNAHHWMIISDDLFDYREALMEAAMRRHGLPDRLVRRWLAVHEAFRREIVKGTARGLVVDGVERLAAGYSMEVLTVGALCDGCEGAMPSGTEGRMHRRTGKLFCQACAARSA